LPPHRNPHRSIILSYKYGKSSLKTGKDEEKGFFYPEGLRWRCKLCGACCRNPQHRERRILLLPSDIKRLEKEAGNEFYKKVKGNAPYLAKLKKKNDDCIFLDCNICKVYSHRPLLCRTYPFYIELSEGYLIINVDEKCPGLGEGEMVKEEDFKKLLEFCISVRGI
jgi:Fe-S-cluster containining protein